MSRDCGHFSLYFEGDSFVKHVCDLAKTRRSKKLENIFFMQGVAWGVRKSFRKEIIPT